MNVLRVIVAVMLAAATARAAEGPADLEKLAAEVVGYESGKDTVALRAMESAVTRAMTSAPLRSPVEAALVKVLSGATTFEAKRFACQQLGMIGSEASVPALAALLKNDETVGIACLALANSPSAKADEAMRAALPALRGAARVQVINTIGNRRDAAAVEALVALAQDADAPAAESAIVALGKIGTKPAYDALLALRKEANVALASAVVEGLFQVADRLVVAKDAKSAVAIYEGLLTSSQLPEVRRGALGGLLRLDADGGQQRIADVLKGSDSVLRPVAIAAVRNLPATSAETFAADLTKLSPTEQAMMIASLAAVGSEGIRTAIRGQVSAADSTVRVAAITAMGKLGDTSDVPALAKALIGAAAAQEQSAAEQALVRLAGGEKTEQAIVAELEKSAGADKAKLVPVVVRRGSRLAVPGLLKDAGGDDANVAKAALQALGALAGAADLDGLIDQLLAAGSPETRREAESAVTRVLGKIDDVGKRSEALCVRLGKTTDVEGRCSLLRLLPVAGGPTALNEVKAACADGDARVRDVAVRALADWRDPAAWDSLMGVYRQPQTEPHRVLALRALVRLAGAENAKPTPALVDRYRQLLDGAKTDADRRLILGSLAGVAHADALELVKPLAANSGVKAEAELAIKKISASLKGQK